MWRLTGADVESRRDCDRNCTQSSEGEVATQRERTARSNDADHQRRRREEDAERQRQAEESVKVAMRFQSSENEAYRARVQQATGRTGRGGADSYETFKDGTEVLFEVVTIENPLKYASKLASGLKKGWSLLKGLKASKGAGLAHNAADFARYKEHLRQLERYGQGGFKELESGRFRY